MKKIHNSKLNYSNLVLIAAFTFGIAFASTSQAALVSEDGGQLVYDTGSNITWTANSNLSATNAFGVSGVNTDGSMTWGTAQSWIGAMNAADYLGHNNWRLPTTLQPDATCSSHLSGGISFGKGCAGSEMGQFYYTELGGLGVYNFNPGTSIPTIGGGFITIPGSSFLDTYWSGTQGSLNTANAWFFDMTGSAFFGNGGIQNTSNKSTYFNVWAVLPGDAAPSSVPVPAAVWLFGSGLLGLVGVARNRKAA